MSLLPIEIIANVTQWCDSRSYESLLYTSKDMMKDLHRYTDYAYPMNKNQKEAYESLRKEKNNYIRFVTMPRTGGSLVLINYMYIYVKENPDEKVTVICEESKSIKWYRMLFNIFEEYQICDEKTSSSKFHRFIVLGSQHKYKESQLIIASCRYSKYEWNRDDPSIRFIFSHYIYERKEMKGTPSCVFKKSILPFISMRSRIIKRYPNEPIDFILRSLFLLHDKITVLGGTAYRSNNQDFKVFNGESEARNFSNHNGKALLVYENNYLSAHTPSLSGIVLVRYEMDTTTQYSSDVDSIRNVNSFIWNIIFTSKDIELVYYLYVERYSFSMLRNNKKITEDNLIFFSCLFDIEINLRLEALGEKSSTKNTSFCRYIERYPISKECFKYLDEHYGTNKDPFIIIEWQSKHYFTYLYEKFKRYYPLNSSLSHLLLSN